MMQLASEQHFRPSSPPWQGRRWHRHHLGDVHHQWRLCRQVTAPDGRLHGCQPTLRRRRERQAPQRLAARRQQPWHPLWRSCLQMCSSSTSGQNMTAAWVARYMLPNSNSLLVCMMHGLQHPGGS